MPMNMFASMKARGEEGASRRREGVAQFKIAASTEDQATKNAEGMVEALKCLGCKGDGKCQSANR